MSNKQAVVIGAGPAGLAAAAELGRRGVPAVVLERDAVAASWRTRYDRLRLNSSRPFAKLPGARYPRGTGIFPTRDDTVAYFASHAADNRLDIRLGVEVECIDRGAGGWVLRTSAGDVRAEQVIVATGYAHTPFVPAWPGRERFQGTLIHAAEYRNADPFRGRDVLVVGPGCSGMEIAHELATEGAAQVRLAVRTPPNIIIRMPIGPLLARTLMKLGARRADAVMRRVRLREIGDLTEYGLPIPDEGLFSRLERLRVAPAIVDREVIDSIKARRIEIVAGVSSLHETGATLADGTRVEADAVIAATGYRTGLASMVGHLGVLDERGVPRVNEAEAAPGLRFVGYRPRPAHISVMGAEAQRAARDIARRRPVARRHPGRLTPAPGQAA
ncbi:MAG TPA: NAD(P)/FAD-dependent oxidoreductase [Solirubrobacteraceae bacterium]|nr:NAD(P)/FAD-dependent oxidoreductase [Solirubrobacteraceae bacterium]